MKNHLKTKEVLEKTKIPFYQLEYLIKLGIVSPLKRGRGVPRLYKPETVEIIKEWLKKIRIPK